jgi:alpha-tubulin suppressor-like RCC1 family protein
MKTKLLLLFSIFTLQINAQCWDKIASGAYHTVAVAQDGTLWSWGYNNSGQLGDGTTTNRTVPTKIGTDTDWVAIGTGYYHSFGIKSNGTLWAWGYNYYGQLGRGSNGNGTDLLSPTQIGADTNWKTVSGGGNFTLAVKTDGTMWSTGKNSDGQLGINTTTDSKVFVQIGTGTTWDKVFCGGAHSMALTTGGILYLWGDNASGQLGFQHYTDRKIPTVFASNISIKTVAGNGSSTIAIGTDGKMWRAGLICPIPNSTYQMREYVTSSANWTYVSIGDNFTIAAKSDGSLWTIGNNNYGQFGISTPSTSTSFVQVATSIDENNIDTNFYGSFYLSSNKVLYSSGQNHVGQLANGTTTDSNLFSGITCPSQIVLSSEEFDSNNTFSIYPNPVKNTLNIALENNSEIQKVVIYDVVGKQVKFQEGNTSSIAVDDLKSGFYFLEITIDGKSETKKFVKQ